MHFKYVHVPFFLNINFVPYCGACMDPVCSSSMYTAGGPPLLMVSSSSRGPTHTSLLPLKVSPCSRASGPPKLFQAFRSPQWAPQTTAEVRKKGIYCISAIYTYELLLRRFAHDLKTWHYSSFWWPYPHGNEPNMDRSLLHDLGATGSRFSSRFCRLSAQFLPVAATFSGARSRNSKHESNKKEKSERCVHLPERRGASVGTSMQNGAHTGSGGADRPPCGL